MYTSFTCHLGFISILCHFTHYQMQHSRTRSSCHKRFRSILSYMYMYAMHIMSVTCSDFKFIPTLLFLFNYACHFTLYSYMS